VQVGTLCAEEVDIHKHTRALGQLCRDNFYVLDAKYQFSAVTDFEATVKEILEFAAKDEKIKTRSDCS
jgi:hypothetical protein